LENFVEGWDSFVVDLHGFADFLAAMVKDVLELL
jgi:hypothetical protein